MTRKKLFWRFGPSVPLTMALLARVGLVVAFAWAVYAVTNSFARSTISVKPPPANLNLTFNNFVCAVAGAGSAGAPSWNAGSKTLDCAVTGADDTSVVSWGFNVTNNEGFLVNVATTLPASTACFGITKFAGPATLGAGAGAGYEFRATGIVGPSGTITCAGTTLPAFSVAVDVSKP